MVVVDVGALVCPDLADVDALARLNLVAGRAGWTIRFRGACEELRALVRFAGLDEVLLVEVVGEAEGPEQLRVQEAVEPRDSAV